MPGRQARPRFGPGTGCAQRASRRIRLQAERKLAAGNERFGQPLDVAAEALSPAPLDSLGEAGVLRLGRQALFRQPDQLGTAVGVGLDGGVPVPLEEADRRRDRLFRHTPAGRQDITQASGLPSRS